MILFSGGELLTILAPLWSVLAPFWDRVGSVLGPFWNHFGTVVYEKDTKITGSSGKVVHSTLDFYLEDIDRTVSECFSLSKSNFRNRMAPQT